jgi:protein-S-isoprenylcysteine O-methyltransferase Ste14
LSVADVAADQEVRAMHWLQTPVWFAGLGLLLVSVAVLLAVASAVGLGLASVWMPPERAKRARAVIKALTRMVAALRKAPPT